MLSQPQTSNATEWSVSELAGALKRTLEDAFGHVRLRGEISGYRGPHSSGHAYFSLKDANACIEAVIWRKTFMGLRFKPQEGLEVIAIGRITTFPGKSKYQIVVDALEPAGIGALMALVEERRRKLAGEGLFDQARKRPLPYLPRVIGVVTSPTGAVIRDILHRLADRFPCRVLVWPARVQGETSGAEVACGIRGLNALAAEGAIPRPDLIIVARGGGSLEDLWGFNEEEVVRAAAASDIPLISAVGHETDWPLLDHAADVRAPTPTGAAEMAVPVRSELVLGVDSLARRHGEAMLRGIEVRRRELRSAGRALPSPDALLAAPRQRVDLASARLGPALLRNAREHDQLLRAASAKLARCAPHVLLAAARSKVQREGDKLGQAMTLRRRTERQRLDAIGRQLEGSRQAFIRSERSRLAACRERVATLSDRARRAVEGALKSRAALIAAQDALLNSLGYRSVLARGYALVRTQDGDALARAVGVQPGQTLDVEFYDGSVRVTAQGERRPRRRAVSGAQPTLFDA